MRLVRLLHSTMFLRSLIIIFVFQFLAGVTDASATPILPLPSDQKCQEIDISFEVINDRSIKIDLKEVKSAAVIISLVGSKGLYLQDIKESEIKDLSKGIYTLIIVGRLESSGYCPKQFQVIIK